MGFLLVHALTGLAGASSLFLVASGLTVIFGVTRVVNFAHGSLTMLGAYLGWTILTHLPQDPASFALGVLGTAAGLAALGALLEMGLLRRLYRSPEPFQLLATFGVVLIIQDAALAIWGPDDLTISRPPWLRGFVRIAGERFPAYDLVLIAIGPVMLALLWLVFNRTRWGRWCRPRRGTGTWSRPSGSISGCCSPRCSRSAPGWRGWPGRSPCRTGRPTSTSTCPSSPTPLWWWWLAASAASRGPTLRAC